MAVIAETNKNRNNPQVQSAQGAAGVLTGAARAKLNYLRIAPRKVRLVADLVKGLSVNEAEAQLILHRQRAAKPLLKLLRSAVANAKNAKLSPDRLMIRTIQVDQGPMLHRSLPRARGMATPIQKKMSHVTIVLAEAPNAPPRFKIVVRKKVKKETGVGKGKVKPKVQAEGGEEKAPDKKPGFFRRRFSRKAV